MSVEVQHDENARKYYAVVDGKESVVQYRPVGTGTLDFWRTFVPPELRGKGIAEELVRHALDDAKQRGLRVIPSCWYVRLYVDRHPDYLPLVAG